MAKSPFPGMDPYLEAPEIWPDFHDALAGELRGLLNESLPAPYYARLEMRSELGIATDDTGARRIIPDVTVVRSSPASGTAVAARSAALNDWLEVETLDEMIRHPYVEIRDAARGHELVTLIEIASPSNKQPGPDRKAYQKKQAEILESDANLVEIDLLRFGSRVFAFPEMELIADRLNPPAQYFVSVSRASQRNSKGGCRLRPIRLTEALPDVPIPLREPDADVVISLQAAFDGSYNRGPYHRGAIDYGAPPRPALSPELEAWRVERLTKR